MKERIKLSEIAPKIVKKAANEYLVQRKAKLLYFTHVHFRQKHVCHLRVVIKERAVIAVILCA